MVESDEIQERKLHARFENKDDFVALRDEILALDLYGVPPDQDNTEWQTFQKIINIVSVSHLDILSNTSLFDPQFASYQEQSYLWDAYLENLIAPVVEKLKKHVKDFVSDPTARPTPDRLEMLALFLYNFVKFRGYKTISPYPVVIQPFCDDIHTYISQILPPRDCRSQYHSKLYDCSEFPCEDRDAVGTEIRLATLVISCLYDSI